MARTSFTELSHLVASNIHWFLGVLVGELAGYVHCVVGEGGAPGLVIRGLS